MTDRPAGFFAPPAWLCCTEQEMLDARAVQRAEGEVLLRNWRKAGKDLREHLDREMREVLKANESQ